MAQFSGTGQIRQQNTNVNINTYGLNVMDILKSPDQNTFWYYYLLGSGTQSNRIRNYKPRPAICINIRR